MNIRELCYERVEQYFADVPGTDYNLLQLTPGALNFRSARVDLDGVVFEWNRATLYFPLLLHIEFVDLNLHHTFFYTILLLPQVI
ncbi:MAG: hypothetical protein U9P00_06610, partial [Pseudomonadota bacterium]|nr:hypothetical protein [Pseudomonadota bacterium]